jgi:DNA adenine methylase
MRTPLRYAGGKSRGIKYISEFVKNYDRIISPFIGGGSLEFHWACNMNKEVIGYDIFDILVIFWDELLHNNDNINVCLLLNNILFFYFTNFIYFFNNFIQISIVPTCT